MHCFNKHTHRGNGRYFKNKTKTKLDNIKKLALKK